MVALRRRTQARKPPSPVQIVEDNVMSKEDIETLNLRKSMMERGECPPLAVVFDPKEGCRLSEEPRNDDGDITMTLLSAATPSKSLVICPYEHGNIAHFINGINNHTPDGRKKQNLKCVRFDVDGESRVLDC